MCNQCKTVINGMSKKKKRISGMDSAGMLKPVKDGALALGGYAIGQYATKAMDKPKADGTSNRGLIGAAKMALAVVGGMMAPADWQEYTTPLCSGIFVSGGQDLIVVNSTDMATKLGMHGFDYGNMPGESYPTYPNAPNYERSGDHDAAGNKVQLG
jgi:hypothetical protein